MNNDSVAELTYVDDVPIVKMRHLTAPVTLEQFEILVGAVKAEVLRLNSKEGLSALPSRRKRMLEILVELELLRKEHFPLTPKKP